MTGRKRRLPRDFGGATATETGVGGGDEAIKDMKAGRERRAENYSTMAAFIRFKAREIALENWEAKESVIPSGRPLGRVCEWSELTESRNL